MKKKIFLLVLFVLNLSCTKDPVVENFKVQIDPASPPIIFSTQKLFYNVGDEFIEVEIIGPWMLTSFAVVNNNDRTITIASAELFVTGPDGERRQAIVFNDISIESATIFGVFRAEGDKNCDGVVSDLDLTAAEAVSCPLDDQNPSFQGTLFRLYGLMGDLSGEDLDEFRGGSFAFEMRFEGWTGGPSSPEESFLKTIFFTVSSKQ